MSVSKEISPQGVEFNRVKATLDDLAQAVIRQLRSLQLAVINNDAAQLEAIVAKDRDIDDKELHVDKVTRSFMELRAPLGPDFRYMMGALDIARNLERIGDCVEYVARHAHENAAMHDDFPEAWDLLVKMIAKCQQILEEAHRAWQKGDAELARVVPPQDDFVDALQEAVYAAVIRDVRATKVDVEQGIVAILMCNKLESIADIACHIAEQVVFMLSAKQIRHDRLRGRSAPT